MKVLLTAGWDVAPEDDPELRIWKGGTIIPEKTLLSLAGDVDGIVCGDEPYTAEIMDMIPNLKVLARCGNGWDGIDKKAALERGIKVTRVEGAYKEAVADSTMSMILALARRTISLNKSMHEGAWERERYPGVAMRETVVGIIGLGAIGDEVRQRLVPFGGKIMVHRPLHGGSDSWPLDDLLALSNFVTLHLKLTPETHHFMGLKELYKMKIGSYLINTSRGGLVDTDALIDALNSGHLAGAGLDVFEQEPLPINHKLRFMDNVILAPHNSYWSPQERKATVMSAINEAKRWIAETSLETA